MSSQSSNNTQSKISKYFSRTIPKKPRLDESREIDASNTEKCMTDENISILDDRNYDHESNKDGISDTSVKVIQESFDIGNYIGTTVNDFNKKN